MEMTGILFMDIFLHSLYYVYNVCVCVAGIVGAPLMVKSSESKANIKIYLYVIFVLAYSIKGKCVFCVR